MPTMKNRTYGAPMGAPDPTTSTAGRPKAGPADDATVKQLLKARLAEREPAPSAPAATAPSAAAPSAPASSADDTFTLNPVRNLKDRPDKLNKAIANSGG